jgi:hypothetical protein
MIYITQSPSTRVELPDASGFEIRPRRARAARTAVAGNVIRQESALHASTAEATYSRDVDRTLADAIETIHTTSSAVTVFYRNVRYQATISLQENRPLSPVRSRLSFTLSIVREGL